MNNSTECDYLIIGGGTAGCIVAHRLAHAFGAKVILIEAGSSDENDPATNYLSALEQQDDRYDWGYHATPVAGSSEQLSYARARVLGGCANHNDCAFLTPPIEDFEDWVSAGARGWSYSDLQSSILKINNQLNIESSPLGGPLAQAFIDANTELGTPFRNFRESIQMGSGWFPLNASGDVRQSSSVAYLHPLAHLPANLSVITGIEIERLLIENRRVIGAQSQDTAYRARREVILCCGSINSPKLLMLSGIGPGQHLQDLGIPVVQDLPGVGQNLMDHAAANIVYSLKEPAPKWQRTPCEATAMINLTAQGAPEILYHFVPYLREKYSQPQFSDIRHGIKIAPNVTRPLSRGELHLASPDTRTAPIINLNYFSDKEDLDMKQMLAGLRYARKLGQTRSLSQWITREELPGPEIKADIDLARYVRQTCETVYHPAGTCKIGRKNDATSVLTADLKVRGVENLRVVDASVFPSMISVNICNMVMIVAENAASKIISDN